MINAGPAFPVALLCALLANCLNLAWASGETGNGARTRERAVQWLKENTGFVPCDHEHFIYGVGYIDGSYMERIFYVEGGGAQPALSVRFREAAQLQPDQDGNFGPAHFVLEMKSPRVLYATPVNGQWRVSDEGWETELRFKYTSWYGTVSRHGGQWKAEWQGYRKPMLPLSVTDYVEEACALFAGG